MERYSQFRDRGSGIAPFLPVSAEPSSLPAFLRLLIFLGRLPLILTAILAYFLLLAWLPVGSVVRKAGLWAILLLSGMWWVDLQIDRVRKGSLAKQNKNRLPQPGSVIASSFTSPIDCLYLAAIFDPVFTASYPNTRQVRHISLAQAILRAFLPPEPSPPPHANLTDLRALVKAHPDSCIVVFPECTTTNGRGILQFSPSLLSTPADTKIFPISLRYTPGDITTPVPGRYGTFVWNLCSRPTHCIRVRFAECTYNTSLTPSADRSRNSYNANIFDVLEIGNRADTTSGLRTDECEVLDHIADNLARLGRVKRVSLGVAHKAEFVKLWTRKGN